MSRQDDKYFTQLDIELQNLATTEWNTFCELAGEEMMMALKICFLRRKNKSYGIIKTKLGITRSRAQYNSKNEFCNCNKDNKQL